MSEPLPRILVVDDDPRLCALLAGYLAEHGFRPETVGSGAEMERALASAAVDLIVLDLTLPGEDGLALCRRLAGRKPAVPVLILSARGEDIDRVVGLEIGADDYLAKPFNPRELVARIRAVLRRAPRLPAPATPAAGERDRVRFGDCELDLGRRRLTRDGVAVPLTGGELALLLALAASPGRPLSRDRLADVAFGRDREAGDRSIDVLISRLRQRLGAGTAEAIQTVRGFGYVFLPGGGTA